jgi:urease accessory protein
MKKQLIMLGLLLLPVSAFAHPGHDAGGFVGGFFHPFTGLDHMIAMIALGMWAAMRKRSILVTGSLFLGGMLLAGALGMQGRAPAMLETLVVGSALLASLLVALAARLPLTVQLAISALFAIVHGMAHGVEMPDTAMALPFAAGFLFASAVLFAGGAFIASKLQQQKLQRIAGGVLAIIAGFMLVTA